MRLLYGTLLACLLSACADRRDPQDLLRRRVALMEAGFRAAHSRAYPKVRALSVPDTDYVKLPVDDLIRRTREHAAKFVSDPARIPDQDLAPHERATFASLYELCLREEILRAGTAFWRAVSLGQPDSCGGTPEGYYEDFAGGALCVVSNGVGFRVHAQAGRAGWKDLYAEAKGEGEGKVVDGRIMGVMRTPGSRGVVSMELAVAAGVARGPVVLLAVPPELARLGRQAIVNFCDLQLVCRRAGDLARPKHPCQGVFVD
ncbi:MAG: hypothetical protein ACO3ND_10440, partial [Opitutales bacterium]